MEFYNLSNEQTKFLNEYRPQKMGFTSFNEIKEIKSRFEIGNTVKETDLQHLRNAVVQFYSEKIESVGNDVNQIMPYIDSMQSVTAVIDTMIYHY